MKKKQYRRRGNHFQRQPKRSSKRGLLLHRQGKLGEAEPFYVEVVQLNPTHFDALHFLGVIALQTGRTQ